MSAWKLGITEADRAAVYGVCPYSDGSGYEFTVMAEVSDDSLIVHIQHGDDVVRMTYEQWNFVQSTVVRALEFVAEQGGDR